MNKGDPLNEHEWLLRRGYFPDKKYIRKDFTISDTVFQPNIRDELKLSVDIERFTTYERTILDPKKFRICKIQAQDAYQLGLECIYDPLQRGENTHENNAHALICGFEKDDLVLPGLLARRAIIVEYP